MKTAKTKKPDTLKKVKMMTSTFMVLTLLFLLVGGYFGYQNFTEFQQTQTALASAETQLEQLQEDSSKANVFYGEQKQIFDEANEEVLERVDSILPPGEEYTELARDLDGFFLAMSKTEDIFLSDVRFDQPRTDADEDYSVLPLTMSMTGTQSAFKIFLEYVENTGDLNFDDRILTIESINLNFDRSNEEEEVIADEDKKLNVSLQVHAYYKKPKGE